MLFWLLRGVKGQKTVKNDKKICLSHFISQEPYIIWLPFMVQICKIMMSPSVFFNVKILMFQVVRGWKGQKKPKTLKISFCCTLYFRNHISYCLYLWYTCLYRRIISPGIFFIFFIILIFRIIRGEVKGQRKAQNYNFFCLPHSISQEP